MGGVRSAVWRGPLCLLGSRASEGSILVADLPGECWEVGRDSFVDCVSMDVLFEACGVCDVW